MHVVFLDRSTFSASVRFRHELLDDCRWTEFDQTVAGDVVERAGDADVIVTNKVRLSGDILSKLPQLKLIAVAATGVDHIDLEFAARHGIAVSNVTGYATHTVPEHVFCVLLALRRNLASYRESAINGEWSSATSFCLHDSPIHDLAGSTIDIIGFGQNGEAVAKLAEAFGMRVLISGRRNERPLRPGRAEFYSALEQADVVSLHVPLKPETRHLIGINELARMKKNAILINTARGGVVEESALAEALRTGAIAGAAIDVLSNEPPPVEHVLIGSRLPNLLLTPHIAWASQEAQQRLADELIENILAFRSDQHRHRIV